MNENSAPKSNYAYDLKNQTELTVSQAAKLLKVSASSLRRMEKSGKITSERTESNYRIYRLGDVLRLRDELAENSPEAKVNEIEKQISHPTAPSIIVETAPNDTPQINKTKPAIQELLATKITSVNYFNKRYVAFAGAFFVLFIFALLVNPINLFEKYSQNEPEDVQLSAGNDISGSSSDASVLAQENTQKNWVFNLNLESVFRKNALFLEDASVNGDLDVIGLSQLEGGIETPTLTFTGNGTINLLDAIDQVTEDTLEDALDINGDVVGTGLRNVQIADNVIGDNELVNNLNFTGTLNLEGDFQIGGTDVISTADEINLLSGLSVVGGGVIFGDGSNLAQDTSNFVWDNVNKRLGIGTGAPAGTFSVGSGSDFQVNGNGAISAATGITSSGTITFSSLVTDGVVTVSGGELNSKAEGSGGGIDVDRLDGLEGVQFLRSDTSDTYTSGTLSFSNSTFLDLSGVLHDDASSQGLRLPQNTSLTPLASGEGYIAWDTDDDVLRVFDGTSWNSITGLFTDGGATTYLTSTTDDFALGGTNASAPFFVDVSTGDLVLAGDLAVNGDTITSDGATLVINAGGAVDIQDAVTVNSLTTDVGGVNIAAGQDLVIGTIGLSDAGTASNNSGANLVAVYTPSFTNTSPATSDLQTVLETFDSAIGSGASRWSVTSNVLHPNVLTDDLSVGTTSIATAPFAVDVSANTVYIGDNSTAGSTSVIFKSDAGADTGTLAYNTNDQFQFSGGDVFVSGQLIAGSTPVTLTTSAGNLDADALGLISGDGAGLTSSGSGLETDTDRLGLLQGCANGEILKWNNGAGTWDCSSDQGAVSAVVTIQENDTTTFSNIDTVDFINVFSVTESPVGEVNVDIASDVLLESHLDLTTHAGAGQDNYVLTFDNASGGFTWVDPTTLGTNYWTDGGTITYLTSTTDDLALGGSAVDASAFFFDVSAGTIQFEGSTADTFETTLTIADPTADNAITLPDASGEISLLGQTIENGELANSSITFAGDSGSSATSLGGTRTIAGGTGITTSESAGTLTITNDLGSSIETGEITDDTILEADLDMTAHGGAGQDGYLLSYDNASGGFTWVDPSGAGINYWTDGGTVTYLTSTTDDLALGGNAVDASAFFFDVSAGTIQFEGASADTFETTLTIADPTADNAITLPDASGEISLLGQTIENGELANSSITFAGDSGSSATSLGGTRTIAGGTGITTSESAGTLTITNDLGSSIETGEITDDTILEADLDMTAHGGAGQDGYLLSYDNTSGGFTWVNPAGAGINYWTDGGTVTYLTSTTDDLAIGGSAVDASAFFFDVSAGTIQFEGASADTFETTLTIADPTADNAITLPDASGEISLLGQTIENGELANSSITFAGDSGSSATSLGGTRTIAGGTGITTSESAGTLTITNDLGSSIETGEITDDTILEADLDMTAHGGAGQDNYVLTFDNASGGFTWVDPATLGTNYWTDGGTVTYLTSTTDDLAIGGSAVDASAFFFDVSAGTIQFEGASADTFETTLTIADPTADNAITLPDASGEISLLGQTIENGELANSSITFAGDSGSSATSLGGTRTIAGGTGITTSESAGTLTITNDLGSSIETGEITDDTILEADLDMTAHGGAGQDNYVLTFDNASGGFTWVDPATLGTNYWTDGGTVTYLTSTTDDLAIGGSAVDASAFFFDVSAGTIQFEGASADTFETTLTIADPTADNAITLPDASGEISLLGQTIENGELANSSITFAGDSGSSATSLGGTRTIAGGTGITTSESAGTLTITNDLGSSIETGEITDDTILEADLDMTAHGGAGQDNYILTYDNASGGFTWVDPAGVGTNYWTDGGTVTYLTSTTDDLAIGGSVVDASAFFFDVSAGTIQFEGSTADTFETTLTIADPTADNAITLPDASGEISLLGQTIENGELANSSITFAGDSGSSATSLGGTRTIAGGTGITTSESAGTLTITNDLGSSIETGEITDDTILEADLDMTAHGGAGQDGYLLSYDNASGGFTWINPAGAGVNYWTDGGTVTYLTSITDDLALGGSAVDASAFFFDVSAGTIQFEGSTADTFETTLTIADPTADNAITLPDASGEISLLGQTIENGELANSSITFAGDSGSSATSLGGTRTIAGGTGITTSESAGTLTITNDLGSSIETGEITDDTILEADLDMTAHGGAGQDGYLLSYDNASGGFTWINPAGGVNFWTDSGTVTYLTSTTDDLALGGTTVDASAFFFDVSAGTIQFEGSTADTFETTLTIADPTADNAITLPDASGEISLLGQTIETGEITDDTILEADLDMTAHGGAGQDGYLLSYDNASGGFTWINPTGAGTNYWTDGGTVTYLTSTTDDLAIGGSAVDASAFFFDVSAGTIQFEGSTADTFETTLTIADPTADNAITLPDASGEISLLGQTIETGEITDDTILEADLDMTAHGGAGQDGYLLSYDNASGGFTWINPTGAGTNYWTDGGTVTYLTSTTDDLAIGGSAVDASAFFFDVSAGTIQFEGSTADTFETTLTIADPTADNAITLPDASGEISLLGQTIENGELANSSITFAGDSGSSATSLGGTRTIAGGTGITTSESAGTLTITNDLGSSIETGEITDDTILEADLDMTAHGGAGQDNYVLTFDNASGGFTWVDPATLGTNYWTDGGTVTYLTSTTDDLALGGSAVDASAFFFDVSAGTIQFEGSTADTFETTLTIADPTADNAITLPDASGEISLLGQTIENGELANSSITFAGDSGSSATSLGGTRTIAGGTGITTSESAGTLTITNDLGSSIETGEITDDTILEADLDMTAHAGAGEDNYILTYDNASGGFTWVNPASAGTNYWTDGGTTTYLTSTTDDLAIGGSAVDASAFFFDVSAGTIQFEGSTADTFETTLTIADPTADNAITLPDASGEISLLGQTIENGELANSSITFAGDSGSSATSLGGTRTIAGGTGITTSESAGTLTITNDLGSSIETGEITDDTILEADLDMTAHGGAGQDNYILTYDNASGGFTWVDPAGVGTNYWTDGGTVTYLTSTTDDLAIGGSVVDASAFFFDVSAGTIQFEGSTADTFETTLTIADPTADNAITLPDASGEISLLGQTIENGELANSSITFAGDSGSSATSLGGTRTIAGGTGITTSESAGTLTITNDLGSSIETGEITDDTILEADLDMTAHGGAGQDNYILTYDNASGGFTWVDPAGVGTNYWTDGGTVTYLTSTTDDLAIGGSAVDASAFFFDVSAGTIQFEGSTADTFETTLTIADPTADNAITLPDASGEISLLGQTIENGELANSSITFAGDSGSSATSLGGTRTIAGGTGITTSESAGTLTITNDLGSSIETGEITDDTILEADLDMTAHAGAGEDNYILTYDNASGGFTWVNPASAGTNYWTDGGTTTYLTSTTDDLAIGGSAVDASAFFFDVSAGTIQFEGSTADTFETTLTIADPTADNAITLPDASGEISLLGQTIENGELANSSITFAGDSGSSATSLGGTRTIAGGTGITTSESAGTLTITNDLGSSIETGEITDDTILEADLDMTAHGGAGQDNYILTYDNASGGFTWVDPAGVGTNYWTDGGTVTYLTSTTDDLAIGGSVVDASAFFFDVSAGTIQFEGSTADTFETTLTIADPTADNAITLPDASGEISLLGQTIENGELANSSITFAGDSGSSATSLGGTRTIAGGTGITTSESAGTLTITNDLGSSIETGEITDDTILEADLDMTAHGGAGQDNYILTYDNASGGFTWVDPAGVGTNYWTDGGTVTYLTSTTDDLAIGGSAVDASAFFFDVSAGTIQFEGSTADTFETTLTIADPTADNAITLPDASGEISLLGQTIENGELANSSITFAGDSGSSATSLGGTRTIAGGTGITTSESAGTLTITNDLGSSIETGEITDDTILEADLDMTAHGGAGQDNYILTYDNASGGFTWVDPAGVGTNYWTDGGTTTYLTSTTDDLALGGSAVDASAFFFDVSAGTIQFEGSTADTFETTLTIADPTADNAITLPDASGEISLLGQTIENGELANSSITFAGDSGSSATSLGGTRTIAGGTGITTSESAGTLTITNDLGSSIETGEITDDTILEADLDMTAHGGAGQDNYILSYDNASGGFTWVDPTSLGTNYWTDGGTVTYLTSTTDDLALGGSAVDASAFFFDVSAGTIQFEGSTADTFETTLTIADPTADNAITLPDASGEISLLGQTIENGELANSSITFAGDSGSSATSLGGTRTIAGGTGITTSESAGTLTITNDLGSSIETGEITDDTILEADLDMTAHGGVGEDGYVLTYDNTSGGFTWVSPGAVGVNYWQRTGTVLSPSTAGDDLAIGGTGSTSPFYVDSSGQTTIAPTTSGTYLDFALETEWTGGTLINADFGSSTSQGSDIIGALLNFNTNLTPAADLDITGYEVRTPALTQSTAVTTNYTGFNLPTAGAITQNTAAGTINWNGVNLQMPNITQTTGTIASNGIQVRTGTSTTGGTQAGLYVNANGISAGTLRGINIGSITAGAGTEVAINIGSGWDTAIITNNGNIDAGTGTITGSTLTSNSATALTINSGTTGTINLGTDASAETINLGSGAAAKTVGIGSSTSTSTTNIRSGSGGVNINASNNQPTNIGTGTTTGTVTIGGSATQTIAIGNGAGIKTVTLGSTTSSSATTINAGTGDLTLTSLDNLNMNLADNIANALDIQQGSDNYININTTDGAEVMQFGNAVTNPNFNFLGTGTINTSATGTLDVNGGLIIGDNNIILDAANTDFTSTGAITFQPAGSSTTSRVQIGAGGAGSTTPDYLALDVKSTTGDPASGGAEGYIYYNTFDNKFRCFEGSGWTDCISTAGLWESGTNGIFEDDSAVIVGADAAFSHMTGAVGDLKVTDQLEALGGAFIGGTDYLSIASTGDITFVDADDGASITGPAGGALSVVAGTGQALTLTGNAASIWSTSAGDLTVDSAAGSLNLTAGEDAADSIVISSDQGGIDISALGAAAGEDIDISASSSINLISSEAVANAIRLQASDTAGGIDVDAGTAGFDLDANSATAFTIGDGTSNFLTFDATLDISDSVLSITDATGDLDNGSLLNLTADTVTTGSGIALSVDGLTTGDGLNITSTSTGLTTGSLLDLYWNPASGTATGDIFKIDIGSNGTLTGNVLALYDDGSELFSVSPSGITSAVPHAFTAAGDVTMAYDLQFTNQTSSFIKSKGPFYIEAGESFENNNLTFTTYGTGDAVFDLQGTGDLVVNSSDPSLVFDTATATDTDFWLGVVEDAGNDDDDVFQIGDGTTPGTNPFLTIDTNGNVGIGDTSPGALLDLGLAENSEIIRFTDETNADTSGIYVGNASPEGVVTAQLGSLFIDNANGSLYVKDSGDGTNTGWLLLTGGGASLWTDGTNGYYSNTEAIIVGGDVAFTYMTGAAGDLRVADDFEVVDDAFIGNDLVVGAATSATETLSNSGFVMGGDDLFVAGMAGIEGNVYTDGSFVAGASTTISNGSISQSSTETLTIGTTSANLALQTTTSGDITLTNGAATGLVNVLTGNLKVGNGTPDVTLNGEDAYIEGTFEVDGTSRLDGNVDLNATLDLDADSATALTIGDGTNNFFTFDTTADAGDTLLSLTDANGSITTGTVFSVADSTLTTGDLVNLTSTSTALTSGSLLDIYWNPASGTATGDLVKIDVGSNGTLTGNLLALYNDGSELFSVSTTGITSAVPHAFTAAGDVTFAYDVQFTNQTASYIKSNAPLYIQAGETFENNDLTFTTYGTGDAVFDLQGTGDLVVNSADPSLVFDTATATDTDFWLGVVEDAGNDDDDVFQIGDGTTPGTNPFLTIDSSGNVGIGDTSPGALLDLGLAENSEIIRFTDETNADTSGIYVGNASPEGVVTAQLGSLFVDNANGSLYVKDSGDGTNTGWLLLTGGGSGSLWTDGANGHYDNTEAIIVGGDVAFTYMTGAAGDLRVADDFEVVDDAFIGNDLVVGAATSATETLSNSGFVMGGDDLFVAGMAGIEGNVYTDGSFIAGASTTISNGSISQSSTETLTIGTTSANLALQTTTSGDITLTNGAATGLVNVLTGNLKVGNGTPDVTLNGEDAYIEGTFEVDGTSRLDGNVDLNATLDLDADSATALTIGDGTNNFFTFDTTADAGDTLLTITDTNGAITTGSLLSLADSTLTTGDALNITSTSTALTTGSLLDLYWNPASGTATGDLFKIDIGASGTLTGNLLALYNNGSELFSVSTTGITSAVPHAFTAAGDVTIAYDLEFTNQTSSNIKSRGPFQIEAGESFESNNLNLKTYNSGDLVFDIGGDAIIQSADPGLIFDTVTTGDTDFWLSVIEDAGGDDDDTLQLGDGTTPGTNTFLTISTAGAFTFSDGRLIDLSSIVHDDSAPQGLKLPQNTTLTAISGGGEGYLAWDTDDNKLQVFNGSTWGDVATGGSTEFTLSGGTVHPNAATTDLAIGVASDTLVAPFSVDESTNTVRIGEGSGSNGTLNLYSSAGDTGSIAYTTSDTWNFTGGSVDLDGALDIDSNTATALTVGDGTNNFLTLDATADAADTLFTLDNVDDAITTGNIFSLVGDGITSGNVLSISADALQGGNGLYIESLSTSSSFSGSLFSGYWNPGSATTAAADLFSIDIGTNATLTGNLLALYDNGSDVFKVGTSQITSAVPHEFTAAGDVSMAYDLVLTNQTASKIESYGPLTIEAGESTENNDLYIQTYGTGEVAILGGGLSLEADENLVLDSNDSGDTYFEFVNASNRVGLYVDGNEEVRFNYTSGSGNSIEADQTISVEQISDLAETYPTFDEELTAGDIVMIDAVGNADDKSALVKRAELNGRDQVVGVVSTSPGFTLGAGSFSQEFCYDVRQKGVDAVMEEYKQTLEAQQTTDTDVLDASVEEKLAVKKETANHCLVPQKALVTLAGRVPVNIDVTAGEIKSGDPITISPTEGKAMVAREAGVIVGRALENVTQEELNNGKDTVMTFMQVGWWQPTGTVLGLNAHTQDVNLDNIGDLKINKNLTVYGDTSLGDTFVLGDLQLGTTKISDGHINVLAGTLYVQDSYASGNVDIFNGKILMTTDGSIKSLATIEAKEVKAQEFTVKGDSDTPTIGSGAIKSGQTKVVIENAAVTNASRVFITPRTLTAKTLVVTDIKPGKSFTVEIQGAASNTITFDYWIVGVEN